MHAVLWFPGLDGPHKVLAKGRCGTQPPRVEQWICDTCTDSMATSVQGESFSYAECRCSDTCRTGTWRSALVLAWDGEPIPEGIQRAGAVLAAKELRGEGGAGVLWSRFIRRGPECTLGRSIYVLTTGTWDRHADMQDVWHFPRKEYDELQVPALRTYPANEAVPLRLPWSLATVCAARLGGEVVVRP